MWGTTFNLINGKVLRVADQRLADLVQRYVPHPERQVTHTDTDTDTESKTDTDTRTGYRTALVEGLRSVETVVR